MTIPVQLAFPSAQARPSRPGRIATWLATVARTWNGVERGDAEREVRVSDAPVAYPSMDAQALYRTIQHRVPITDGRAGYGQRFKAHTGQVRRDFRAVHDGACSPVERLALMLRHAAYHPSRAEQDAAAAFLARPECQGAMNVYLLLSMMEGDRNLAQLVGAVRDGFTFKDRHTPDWRLVYGLVGSSGTVATAEFGVTELCLSKVAERVATGRGVRGGSAIEAFLRAATDIHLVPLESAFGSLDEAEAVKNAWRRAAVRAGLRLGRAVDGADRTSFALREWPGTDWLMSVGLPVGALADTGT